MVSRDYKSNNQEPLVDPPPPPSFSHGSLLNELETAHCRIEGQIRQLEANQEDNHVVNVDGIVNTPGGIDERANGERGRNTKRDTSQLAKALGGFRFPEDGQQWGR
ncbi:hypothetical protein L2E82_40180 [Cichorium intybus]|uniref:Uncharacterized protein n=1 Tax=Cichorium intybus TaxID=13427 RepID=A0ACB9AL90_CICIN|nr:hypothetical protein L2E82_40180 [Cichorium intybus]